MPQRPPIAIVGYAYRAPGVGRKGLWEFLEEGKSAWSPVPVDRFNQDAYHHPDAEKPGFISSKGAHFLPDDIYAFDPSFFRISAEEARSMDPQHRLLLECAFEAVENAGLTLPDLLESNAGVFAAGVDSEYNLAMAEDLPTSSKYMALGIAPTMFANRLSYFFGLTGPSITVDAACASSSYALHLACQSITAGECSTAIVGGAKLLNGPVQWSGLDTMGTLSPEGRCFSYDTRASGFGKGEGAGCIIIKRLSDAIACGDAVRAIIRNTACNHSGRTQGISMPSRAAQEELLRRLHCEIGVEPSETSFVEGHGTGTKVGDPIEASAISSVVASGRSSSNPLHIGSVKSNLGHLEGASGLISIIKCIMMLEHRAMLPNAEFKELNPKIEGSFGGSNAAILLEEAPKTRSQESWEMINGNGIHHDVGSEEPKFSVAVKQNITMPNPSTDDRMVEHLFVFSAQSMNSLQDYLSCFVKYLENTRKTFEPAKDLAFTLGQRRTHFTHRVAVTADSTTLLMDQLQSLLRLDKTGKTKDPIVAFTFTGQGAQYFQMSAGLRRYRAFATTILVTERMLSDLGATWSLTEELDKHEHESRINDAEISQPACTAVQLALVVLLRSWGVFPAVVLGHSSGEIAAAFAAGLVSLKAAIAIAYFRGIAASNILKDTTVQGAMLAIGTSAEETQKLLDVAKGYAIVAAVNSPDSVTISGDVAVIQYIQEQAQKRGLFVRRLKVGVAYHSHHMARVADSYLASIQPFCFSDQQSPGMISAYPSDFTSSDEQPTKPSFMSTVTGQWEFTNTVHASYWVRNLLQPVQYLKAVERLFLDYDKIEGDARIPDVIVEVGPHSALQSSTKQILKRMMSKSGQKSSAEVTYLPSLVRGKRSTTTLLNLAGNLFAMGSELDFAAINQTKYSQVQAVEDLPSYSWNKTARYIHQPQVAASKLNSGAPYNRLLGWKSPYSEGNEQAFRNVFTLDDLPWIRDHVIAGEILFPFTGFVSLAIEGFRSLSFTSSKAVFIREFHVTTSLKIEEDQHVDITTKFRPAATGTETVSSTAWSFEILSWSDSQGWTRHSFGLIEADHSHESLLGSPDVQSALRMLNDKTFQKRDAQDEYALLQANNGLAYGPTFRNMIDLRQAPGATVQTIILRQFEPDAHALHEASPVTVDPPTLDTIFHSLNAIQGGDGKGPVIVPSSCLRWRISNHIAADAGQKFSLVGRLLGRDAKSGTTHMQFVIFEVASSSSPPKPVAEIGPVKLECIVRPDACDLRFPDSYTVKHVPYVDLIDTPFLSEMITGTSADKAELQQRRDLDHAAIDFLSRMLKEIANDDLSVLPFHYAQFLGWAKRAVMAQKPAAPGSAAPADKVSTSDDLGKMICAVGAQLPQILRGEQQPLKIMLADDLLQRSYEQHHGCTRVNQVAAKYIACLAACNPDLNILEIGGGTASATLPILKAIQSATEGMMSRLHYTFTDISAVFFDNARSKLSQWTGQVTYNKLDISQDPVSQGFNAESYDVIVASNVLHATPDIVATVRNARALLKPHGRLVLMEPVRDVAPHFLPFVLLDGWWLSKDAYRSQSEGPLLTKGLWNDLLKENGLSGLEGHVDDYPGQPEHLFSAMWSTKSEIQGATRKKEVGLSVTMFHSLPEEDDLEFPKTVSGHLARQLGGTLTMKHILQHDDDERTSMCVILDNHQRSILSDLSTKMFDRLKVLLLQASSLLWVLPDESHPDASIIKGVLRALRLEASTSRLVLLETPFNTCGARAIARVCKHVLWDPNSTVHDEQEYSLIDNMLHVPRLHLVETSKETFITEAGGSVKGEQNVWHNNDAIELTLDNVGSPDSVYFRLSDILKTELGDEEIVVRVDAVGMNFRDLLLVLGSLSWHAPGLEGAGVVARVGSGVNNLQVGDRVFYIVHEAGMANFVRMPKLRAHRLPEGLDMVDAASIPVAYSTAIMSILEIGRLRRSETILIHSASGAVGQACIMIAQQVGARIFATAGSAEKREFVSQTFGIPTTQIFSSRTPEFKDGILQATDNRGVDVAVNSLSDHLLQQTWDLIAENGRFIEIGKKDLLTNTYLPMRQFDKNVTFSAVDLRKAATARPEAVQEWLSTITRMIEGQKIMPIRPVTRVPISQISTGLRKLQSGQNIGKIVVTVGPGETVMVERLSPLKARLGTLLHSDATYLITGGTGGLGRALASWMIKKGARNLVLLGRSSIISAKVMELLKRYEDTDVCIRAISCDVGSRTDLIRSVEALKDLPRVCGIIHGALCLRDAIFVNATFEDWEQVMGPKVKGAWHLHELFPNLDFFVSLSSMIGIIGKTGESLYAGTSLETFLDAFSEHRVKLGLPAVAVDLPVVESVGLAVERGMIHHMKASIGLTITEDQFYTLIEGAIIGPSSGLNAHGKSLSLTLASKTNTEFLAWERFNPLSVMRRQRLDSGVVNPSSNRSKKLQDLLKNGSPELLMDALSDKVSSITMIDRDEITPDRSLLDYGLDSLFSLELRNWIRRSLDADVALKDITSARDLKALVDRILFLMKSTTSISMFPQDKRLADVAANGELISGVSSPPIERLEDSRSQLPFQEPKLTLSDMPLLDIKEEELDGIQKHLESIGIDVSNMESMLPCTPVQEQILIAQLKSQQRPYWACLTLRITPEGATECVNVDRVAAAWKAICIAQPMLRTVFTSSPSSVGAFQQVVLEKTDPSISHATVELQAELKAVLETMPKLHFAAAQPPHHVHLTRASDSVVYASFYMSHTLFDDRSFRLIGQQLRQAYADVNSIPKGRDLGGYTSWARSHPAAAKEYWIDHLSGTSPCHISLLKSSESSLLDKGSPPYVDVSINQPHLLHAFCRRSGVTVANLVQVAWGIVLRLCNGSRSVIFGCAQSHIEVVEGYELTVGPLLANIICRLDVDPGSTPLDLLKTARDDSLRALELPSCSMAELHEAMGLGQLSLWDTGMTIVRFPPAKPTAADGVRVEVLLPEEMPTESALSVGVGYDNDKVMARLWYDAGKVSRSLAVHIGPLFAAVATTIISSPDQSIEALESSISKPLAAFSAQDVARGVYREAASQCEVAASSLEDICPCSPLQQRLMEKSVRQNSGNSTDQHVFRVPKNVSMTRLQDAWDIVSTASPALRTRIVSLRQGGICQVTLRATPSWHEEPSLSDYLQWDRDFRIRYGGPLCRFGEVDQPDGNRYFVLSLHPATYDPWTLSLILSAVRKVYDEPGEPPASFHPFSAYIRRLIGRTSAQSAQDFWTAQPRWPDESSLQFPCVPHGASDADLSSSRSLEIQLPVTDSGISGMPTTRAVLHAAWALCLSRLSGDGKACFGIHIDGRSVPVDGIARMTGPVAAMVPCAIDLATLATGDSLLEVVRDYVDAVTPFLHTPDSSETSSGQGMGTTSRSFRNVLLINNCPASVPQAGPTEIIEPIRTRSSEISFHGTRLVTRCSGMANGTLCIEMQFDKQVISPEDIEILLQQYKHAITQLLSKPSVALAELEPVSSYERSLLLDWNTNSPSRVDACIQDQIRDVARRQSTAPAICSWECDLDHGQLDDLSDRMAALLQKNGIKAGTMVPFFCEKSAAAIIVMLGILKIGGVLVALDLDYPARRLGAILANVGASTIIASSTLSERVNAKVPATSTVLVDMERIQSLPHGGPQQVAIQPSDTCYVTYTSGSTGTPKGIVISHANLASSVHHSHRLFGMTTATRTLQFSNFIFDAVMYEVFMTLVCGGCVCVPQEAERLNNIAGAIQRTRSNCVLLSPSTATILIPSEVPTLRTLCLCGEPFPRNMIERWNHVRLMNGYGPSETTIMSSQCIVSPNSGKHHLNVGRPTACRYWVVDPNNHDQLVPIGSTGELLVQGPVVAQGYLRDAEKTKKVFIEPPIWTSDFGSLDLSSHRWYKTGDLVKQTADGSVVFDGRKGTQVKLAGQRVELEEVEHHLGRLSDPGWTLAVELIKPSGEDQDPCLAMFFALASLDGELTGPGTPCKLLPPLLHKAWVLRQALVSTLPAYMVPQYFIRLNRLPLTSSWKTDRVGLRRLGATLSREQLRAYSGLAGGAGHEEPSLEGINGEKAKQVKDPEAELRKLWARELALPLDCIKATDDFFSLGGSSIRAMRLVNTARRAGFALTVTDVFSTPVLLDMAAKMRPVPSGHVSNPKGGPFLTSQTRPPSSSNSTSISSSLMTCLTQLGFAMDEIESVAEATDVQADMLAISELDGEGFHTTFTLASTAGFDVARITKACEKLIRHHSLLRTAFVQHGANLEQVVLKTPPKDMILVSTTEGEKDQDKHVGINHVLGNRLPQFRLQVKGERCHQLRFKIRHAYYDAIYLSMILEDLGAAYAQQSLPRRPCFHDWISHVTSLDKAASRGFWRQTLHGSSMTYLVPPTGPATSGYPCRDEISMRVPLLNTSYGTPASVVQAAWALVLSCATGQQDIVFGAPNANRNASFPDIDRLPGPCLNNLPVRARFDDAAVITLGSLAVQIQAQAVTAIPHQHVGVRDIIRNCTDWPPWTRFSSVVLYQNHESFLEHGASITYGDVDCTCWGTGAVGQAGDVWVVVTPEPTEHVVRMSYSRRTLPEEKAQWIARLFQTVLEMMPVALEQPLHRIIQSMEAAPAIAAPTIVGQPSQQVISSQSNSLGAPSHSTSARTRTLVAQAWDEVGLAIPSSSAAGSGHNPPKQEKEGDDSIFSRGADLVTTMLLARCYQRKGYSLSMQDLINHPTQGEQSRLLEARKVVNGRKDEGIE
ncbi:MAG: hypothetical protein Q9179_005489 [Wetmoreana sp. 5 TL-2023]